jgi:hypothetical protein
MASYLSGMLKSMKGFLGFEDLQVEAGGQGEDAVANSNTEERQSLWKQLSQYIGKDVTSMISLPAWVFEPISFLQIMAEPMEYSELLIKASESNDPTNRMGYLMAWICTGYSCAVRSKKAFNPLLGETFEFVPADKRWKFYAEQVSHHPPIGVAEASNDMFVLGLEMEMKTKFRGNSIDVSVLGSNRFSTKKFGDYFTWGHLDTIAHNVIIGGMWVDHFGTLEIINHTTGDRGVLTFSKCGWLGAGRFQISGEIFDKDNTLKLKLAGTWNDTVTAVKVTKDGDSAPILLWKKPTRQPDPKWNWAPFVYKLNEMDEEYRKILPERDSRLRGDRLALEQGNLDLANKEKVRLEEKQRSERKARETTGEHYESKYFKKEDDQKWGHKWVSTGSYWTEREQRVANPANSNNNNNNNTTDTTTTTTTTTTPTDAATTTESTATGDQQ